MKHFKGKSLRDIKKFFFFTFYNKSAYKRQCLGCFQCLVFFIGLHWPILNPSPLRIPQQRAFIRGGNQPVTALQSCLVYISFNIVFITTFFLSYLYNTDVLRCVNRLLCISPHGDPHLLSANIPDSSSCGAADCYSTDLTVFLISHEHFILISNSCSRHSTARKSGSLRSRGSGVILSFRSSIFTVV